MSATDPLVFGGATLLVVAVAIAAAWIPAATASRVSPLEAFRV